MPERVLDLLDEIRERYGADPELNEAITNFGVLLAEMEVATEELLQREQELTESQTMLAEERERWRGLFGLAPDAYVITTRHGLIVQANDRALQVFQTRAGRIQPRTLALHIDIVRGPPFQRILREPSLLDAPHDPVIVRLRKSAEGDFRAQLLCVAVGDDELLWALHDVTPQERARVELEQALEKEQVASDRLRALDHMRRSFLVAVSHDLRSPLAAIATFAGLLQTGHLPEAEKALAVERIARTAEESVSWLRDLLDYERVDSETLPVLRRAVDAGELVETAARSVPLDGHRLALDVGAVPAHVDGPLVTRVVANLVRNAVQHTPAGSTIWVRCAREPDGVLITVEDDGPGIGPDERAWVFELFARSRERDVPAGLGVGLALVRQFAELHGGYARVDERLGGGASFNVLLAD